MTNNRFDFSFLKKDPYNLMREFSLFEKIRYTLSTWWNPRGDLVKWIGPPPGDNNSDDNMWCKAIVRREDSLIFTNTISCFECETSVNYFNRSGRVVDGIYFKGENDCVHYDRNGRHLDPLTSVYRTTTPDPKTQKKDLQQDVLKD